MTLFFSCSVKGPWPLLTEEQQKLRNDELDIARYFHRMELKEALRRICHRAELAKLVIDVSSTSRNSLFSKH